ncbi:hypothetical protein HK100_008280 [Physocladia obscura]|uniref:WD40 repeat-like protein n=1 Tax=Physocladia obscura TaxID=109957 RepID=A0AAD5XL17_9FUNG|nr:hypothetical protein HK100_008280 [Physocladia obscura]
MDSNENENNNGVDSDLESDSNWTDFSETHATSTVSLHQLLFGNRPNVLFDDDDDDDDDDYENVESDNSDVYDYNDGIDIYRQRQISSSNSNSSDDEYAPNKNKKQRQHTNPIPSENSKNQHTLAPVLRHVRAREVGRSNHTTTKTRLVAQLLPTSHSSDPRLRKRFDAKPYCAQFSSDGSLFYAATQDFNISLFAPHNAFSLASKIRCAPGRWTITDCDLSKDNSSLVYSSIHATIFLVNLRNTSFNNSSNDDDTALLHYSSHIALPFNEDCGIWSVRLSEDGREVVAGASEGYIFVQDVVTKTVLHRVEAHNEDVNAVAFADESANILISGSDDGKVKVWDRRSSLANSRPVGVLLGHTEGITFITTRDRDARTVISNAKDQSIKVWDLRKSMVDDDDFYATRPVRTTNFDYRWQSYPSRLARPHPADKSVATFKGHKVLRTLIRCHYSPENTGHRYIYSGSSDGCVYIYDPVLHPSGGPPIAVLKVPRVQSQSLRNSEEDEELIVSRASTAFERARHLVALRQRERQRETTAVCIRDVSWNPNEPQIVASVWTDDEEGALETFVHS